MKRPLLAWPHLILEAKAKAATIATTQTTHGKNTVQGRDLTCAKLLNRVALGGIEASGSKMKSFGSPFLIATNLN